MVQCPFALSYSINYVISLSLTHCKEVFELQVYKWTILCCRCDVIIHLFDDAAKVSVEENVCECGAQTVSVEYKAVSSICILKCF